MNIDYENSGMDYVILKMDTRKGVRIIWFLDGTVHLSTIKKWGVK